MTTSMSSPDSKPNEAAANAILAILEPGFGEWVDKDARIAAIIAKHYTPILERAERALEDAAEQIQHLEVLRTICAGPQPATLTPDVLSDANAALAALRSARTQQDSSTTTQS